VYSSLKRRHGALLKPEWRTIVFQMLTFVGVFVAVWIFPLMNRFLWMADNTQSPDPVWMTSQILIGLFGFVNYVVFILQTRAQSFTDVEETEVSVKPHSTTFFGRQGSLSEHLIDQAERDSEISTNSPRPHEVILAPDADGDVRVSRLTEE